MRWNAKERFPTEATQQRNLRVTKRVTLKVQKSWEASAQDNRFKPVEAGEMPPLRVAFSL